MKFFVPPFTRENIETQYRDLCKILHPDAGGSENDFKDLQSEKIIVDKIIAIHSKSPRVPIPTGKKRIKMIRKNPPTINFYIDPEKTIELIKQLKKLLK